MISYLLHSTLLLSLFSLFYYFFLRNETFFKLNRWSILLGIILSLTLPLIQVPSSWSIWKQNESVSTSIISKIYDPAEPMVNKTDHSVDKSKKVKPGLVSTESPATVVDKISVGQILGWLYLIGAVIFGIVFLMQLIVLYRRKTTLKSFKTGNYNIVEMTRDVEPYSFLHSIFINPEKYDEDTFNHIIEHEKIHIDQSHFVDKLIAEFLIILFWFNPFVWLLRASISKNLEFLTDESLINKGVEKKLYQLSLLKVSVSNQPFNLTMSYNSSFLKNRIKMMNAKKSSIVSSWKYLFILPLFVLSIISLNAVDHADSNPVQNSEFVSFAGSDHEESNPALENPVQEGKTYKFNLSGKGIIDVSTSGGHIALEGQSGNEAIVIMNVSHDGKPVAPDSREWNEAIEGYDITVEKNGNTILAHAKRKSGYSKSTNKTSISFQVKAPHTVEGKLNTSGGHIAIQDLMGDQKVNTSGGHISIENITGQLNANTSGGHISVSKQDGDAQVKTSGGHISVIQMDGNLIGNTSGGAISVKEITGMIDVNTSGGKIDLNGTSSRVKAITSGGGIVADVRGITESMHLQTSGGQITVMLDASKGYDLNFTGGKIAADLNNFSGTSNETKVNGKMNGGGIPITIKNSGGKVSCEFN